MPRSVIEAGLADVIAPVEALPGKINTYLQHRPLMATPDLVIEERAQSGLEKVVILLRAQTGHDFSLYKKTTIYRRIERRMGIHQIDKIANYVRFLQENPQELELLFRELLIGVTSFFRDPQAWERLKNDALPALLTGRTTERTLRAWVPACSTGEEAYSLAILLNEYLEVQSSPKTVRKFSIQIFATDLDQEAIVKAREGVFPANISADVSPERLSRFFVPVGRGYQVAKSIREMVIFAPQNIIMDPPFTKLDLLFCRNLLIYLTPELQKKLLPLFHYSLNPGGVLFLGSAETIGEFSHLFTALDSKMRIYRRLEASLQQQPVEFPAEFIPRAGAAPIAPKIGANIQVLAEQMLLQTYSPAAVLTTGKGDIIYISGRTGKYLEPAVGKANWNVLAMAREGLRYELSVAFQKVVQQGEIHTLRNVVVGTNGGTQMLNVILQPLKEPEALRGMVMIVFTEAPTPPASKKPGKPSRAAPHNGQVEDLERELSLARQEVQTTREEMQTSQEELKSTNEELQSTNEELQSTNEELTTSKEEMQSMNEELQTVNNELQAKVDELRCTNNDMKNLLDSTDIATLFLDNHLCVRRFTAQTGKITRLIPGDSGRPITDIASALLYPELAEDAREVLRTLAKVERQIPIPDGDWYAARILPYRTLENMIDGVVITFSDITAYKKLEAELRG
jgi:chemotaxis methyl-accepting protein methylase